MIAGKCKFTPAEQPVRLVEQLIIATKHVEVQSKLLEKGDKLDLDTAMDVARTYEATKQHVAQMQKSVQTSVHAVSTHRTCSRCGKQHADKNELSPTHEKNVTRVARRDTFRKCAARPSRQRTLVRREGQVSVSFSQVVTLIVTSIREESKLCQNGGVPEADV